MSNFFDDDTGLYDRVGNHLCERWPPIVGFPLAVLWVGVARLAKLFIPLRYQP